MGNAGRGGGILRWAHFSQPPRSALVGGAHQVDRPQVAALYNSVQTKTQAADSLLQVLRDQPTTALDDVTLLQRRFEAAAGLRLITATNMARKRALANEIALLGGELDAAFRPPCLSGVCGDGVNRLLNSEDVENTEARNVAPHTYSSCWIPKLCNIYI
ncbi:hypothetical protein CYMTET_44115 [Cymbomonas tetramitiformis]|uniref:Uncharacterized protein n=1 Tax=Cymbomonas tetramitiformis TaxID=36881 RepID=A0AAE0C2S6_9CHLO|nr:hypothetical protein CYMTET_44115 [Cymbomonas tetramitiformis]